MTTYMQYDDVAEDRNDAQFDPWKEKLFQEDTLREIGNFIAKHHGGIPVELFPPIGGAFNLGHVFSPEEKVRKEVAVMRFIAEKTSIPVPFIFYYGMAEESPAGMGPFIIMEYIKNARNGTRVLNTPGLTREDRPVLDPNISMEKLESIYSQMAGILLQLSQLSFDQIGSIEEVNETWEITDRPLTFNMNELVQMANFPPQHLPSTAYSSTSDYFKALTDTHIMHLSIQHNDAIDSAEDCHQRYIARHFFGILAKESRLKTKSCTRSGSHRVENAPDTCPKTFGLFCDGFRPSSILLDDNDIIVGVIDWEFTYAAPAEYTYSTPWWLLIERPKFWSSGLANWSETYERHLLLFLKALKAKEEEMIKESRLAINERLSMRMKEYWDTWDFWVGYALRNSWAIDMIFWEILDEKFFGNDGGFATKMNSLDTKEVE
ncbi:phosphotransferase family protein [Xylogone sp. PMI_703]|nr:phosphotransferase family protein [Xylogone sp. PMI_703]